MAWEQVLSPEVMARLTATPGGSGWSDATSRPFTVGGTTYQRDELGNIYVYDPNKQEAFKDKFGVYGSDGKFSNEGTFKTDDAAETFMMMLAAAGGMQFMPGGAFAGGGAGGAGYGITGGATEPVTSLSMSGGAGAGGAGGALTGGNALQTLAPVSTIEGPMSSSLLAESLTPFEAGAGATTAGSFLKTAAPYLTAAAPIVGGAIAADAAKDAAKTQAEATREAQSVQERIYNDIVERNKPFYDAGIRGLNQLEIGLGLRDGEGKGDLTRDFTLNDFQVDPGYQFRMTEGNKAIDRFAASRGRFNSGRTAKDLTRFNQDLGAQEYQSAYNRFNTNQLKKLNPLQSIVGVSQTSAGQTNNASQTYADKTSDLITQRSNADASGRVGAANAWTNALSQGISQYQNNELINKLFPR